MRLQLKEERGTYKIIFEDGRSYKLIFNKGKLYGIEFDEDNSDEPAITIDNMK